MSCPANIYVQIIAVVFMKKDGAGSLIPSECEWTRRNRFHFSELYTRAHTHDRGCCRLVNSTCNLGCFAYTTAKRINPSRLRENLQKLQTSTEAERSEKSRREPRLSSYFARTPLVIIIVFAFLPWFGRSWAAARRAVNEPTLVAWPPLPSSLRTLTWQETQQRALVWITQPGVRWCGPGDYHVAMRPEDASARRRLQDPPAGDGAQWCAFSQWSAPRWTFLK